VLFSRQIEAFKALSEFLMKLFGVSGSLESDYNVVGISDIFGSGMQTCKVTLRRSKFATLQS
jgi:hypothetical protein